MRDVVGSLVRGSVAAALVAIAASCGSSGSSGNQGSESSGSTSGSAQSGSGAGDAAASTSQDNDSSSGSSGASGSSGSSGSNASTGASSGATSSDSGETSDAADVGDAPAPSGDGSSGPPPFMATGMPITAPANTWTWVDFSDSYCRDGSTAGVAVNLQTGSDKVMIFLEGGGACFNTETCETNPTNVSSMKTGHTTGIFDRTNTKNPVATWHFVYVPYCTGDSQPGGNPNGMVTGVTGVQKFVGYLNMKAFLNRIVPTFPKASQVLLTGVSAGGFGAASTSYLVARAFNPIPVNVIDDSGPAMSSKYIPTCLQDLFRTTWSLDQTILADCGSACPNPSDWVMDYAKFLASKSTQKSGLLDSSTDSVISAFYGIGEDNGKNDCKGSFSTPVPGATYTAGLQDFRTTIAAYPNYGTYYPDSSQHTWLEGASMYTETQSGTALIDWITNIINGTSATAVGP
jgi:hypothetical protein